jgi:hypothetical protein
MVKLTREKQTGFAWGTVVEDAGGGSLPSWWTVECQAYEPNQTEDPKAPK